MDYHFYHHDDLDGLASGAVFLEFLKTRSDNYASYHPITYSPSLTLNKWRDFKFEKPFVIFDFQYHPDADWWVDHHASAFSLVGSEYKEKFKNDSQHYLDSGYKSACGLLVQFLEEEHGFSSTEITRALAKEVGMLDSAIFETIDDALDVERPINQIDFLLGDPSIDHGDDRYFELRKELVGLLGNTSMEDIVNLPQYKERIDFLKQEEKRVNDELANKAVLRDGIVFVDAHEMDRIDSYFAIWLHFQDIPYGILLKRGDKCISIRVLRNNWAKHDKVIDLGAYASKYGGGGHEGIGAMRAATIEEALRMADEVIEYINNHGK